MVKRPITTVVWLQKLLGKVKQAVLKDCMGSAQVVRQEVQPLSYRTLGFVDGCGCEVVGIGACLGMGFFIGLNIGHGFSLGG